CVFCNQFVEYINHLFLHCNFTSNMWYVIFAWLGVVMLLLQDIQTLYDQVWKCFRDKKVKRLKHLFWHASCRCICNMRNNTIIRNSTFAEPMGCIQQIKSILWQWLLYKRGV
ncbi:hypothetical protein glysoja_028733, partial [Glycine soja]